MINKKNIKKKNRNKRKNGNYLYGKNSIIERLKVATNTIKCVYMQNNFKNGYILNLIKNKDVKYKYLPEKDFVKIKRVDRSQGIIADIEPYKYSDLEKLLNKKNNLNFICLDGITDPHNLGAILRVLACMGGFAVIIPAHNSCEVNDTVMHVASGAENYVPIVMINNLAAAIMILKSYDYIVYGAIVEEGEFINTIDFKDKTCLVMGSEGKGIRKGIRKLLDKRVKIPMNGANLSFNVAIATALFAYEIIKD